MQQTDRDHTPSTQKSPASRPRFPRSAVVLPVASLALAGALAVTLAGGEHRSCPATEAAREDSVSATLDRVASAFRATDGDSVPDGPAAASKVRAHGCGHQDRKPVLTADGMMPPRER
ncbi:hypothetical protein ABZZ80_02125 [Streptomyces sp. NPDC006356]